MLDYHLIIGGIAAAIGLIAYLPYYKDLIKRTIKPHVFTWLIWTLTSSVVFLAQLSKGGGAGAWATGVAAVLTFIVFVVSIFRGEKEIAHLDWAALVAALFSMVLWLVTSTPIYSVILLTVMDVLGYIPTTRKAWKKPNEESVTLYILSGSWQVVSLFALQALNITTFLYPATLAITNTIFVATVLKRRNDLRDRKRK